jgi:hypothetical protein
MGGKRSPKLHVKVRKGRAIVSREGVAGRTPFLSRADSVEIDTSLLLVKDKDKKRIQANIKAFKAGLLAVIEGQKEEVKAKMAKALGFDTVTHEVVLKGSSGPKGD